MFYPTYHHLTKLKYKFVTECLIEKCDVTMQELKSQYCRDILPVYDRLESGCNKVSTENVFVIYLL